MRVVSKIEKGKVTGEQQEGTMRDRGHGRGEQEHSKGTAREEEGKINRRARAQQEVSKNRARAQQDLINRIARTQLEESKRKARGQQE
jgi:hypothetical protein